MSSRNGSRILVRSRKGRMVAGVCAGVAEYWGMDVTMVRLIMAVIAVMTGGAGFLAYLAAWALIPSEGDTTSIAENLVSRDQDAASR